MPRRAILLLVQLWAIVQTTRAYARGPRYYMCRTFHVAHNLSFVNEPCEDVRIILRKVTSPGNDPEEVSCYMPSQEYTVELKSFGRRIGGLLLQANKGRFPFDTSTWRFPAAASGSPLVISGPCPRSVSQKELLKNIIPTPKLKFGYKSPKGRKLLKFRFTVVFDYEHHLENVNISIPPCLTTPHPDYIADMNATMATTATPTTVPPPVSVRIPANGRCLYGKNITHENQTMTVMEHNITYTCVSYVAIRRVACGEECRTNHGAPVCCEVSTHTPRRKRFKCMAYSDIPAGNKHSQQMDMFLEVLVPSSRCSCYLCPAAESPEPICTTSTTEAI